MDITEVYEAVGCPECSGGYRGRIAIQEVLLITPDIRDAINARMSKAELRELVYNSDVISLLQDGLYKVLAGFTTIEEIIKLTESEDEVNAETKIKGMAEKGEAQAPVVPHEAPTELTEPTPVAPTEMITTNTTTVPNEAPAPVVQTTETINETANFPNVAPVAVNPPEPTPVVPVTTIPTVNNTAVPIETNQLDAANIFPNTTNLAVKPNNQTGV